MPLAIIEKILEKKTGFTASEIREMPVCEWRRRREKETGRRFRFFSAFPHIGRAGNVLRDRLKNHDEVEKEVDEVLEDLKKDLRE